MAGLHGAHAVSVPRACLSPSKCVAQDIWHQLHRADVPHRQWTVNAPPFLSRALAGLPSALLYRRIGSYRCTLVLLCPGNLTRQVMGLIDFKFASFRLRNSAVFVASKLTTLPLLLLVFNGSSSLKLPRVWARLTLLPSACWSEGFCCFDERWERFEEQIDDSFSNLYCFLRSCPFCRGNTVEP